MEKGKRIETDNVEITLPEATIQHIQSFLNRKEAARSAILSKSWYNAWLTRPNLDIDDHDFYDYSRGWCELFEEFAKKTMQRYQDSRLKIESFRLCSRESYSWSHELIADAMKIGAIDVELKFPYSFTSILPREVLASETLVRLSVNCCIFDENSIIGSLRLKSLTLEYVIIKSDVFKDLLLACCNSLEELSLSNCNGLSIALFELHKLTSLSLSEIGVVDMFFINFKSQFPCLKDLSIYRCRCHGSRRMKIASTSLETVSFTPFIESDNEEFDVPNIRKFTYSLLGMSLPYHRSIKGALREWELDILVSFRSLEEAWFVNLKKLLTKLRPSRISLQIHSVESGRYYRYENADIEVGEEPLVVENLSIDAPRFSPSTYATLVLRSFVIFRPNYITHYWYAYECNNNKALGIIWNVLMHEVITPNCEVPYHGSPKKVNVEVYEMFDAEWRPLLLDKPLDPSETPVEKRKVRFQLIWD